MPRHKHEFTLLYGHFGKYRRDADSVHYHVCFDYDCDRVVVGEGRSCDGKKSSHHRETLTASKGDHELPE